MASGTRRRRGGSKIRSIFDVDGWIGSRQREGDRMKTLEALALTTDFLAAPISSAYVEKAETHVIDERLIVVEPISRLPQHDSAISAWRKAAVSDPREKKLGEIEDMLVDPDGSIAAEMLSVGGFLGVDEKYVAVPLRAFTWTKRYDKIWLTLDTTKDALTHAAGHEFDERTIRWEVEGD
jgi:hypothetical protein